MCIGPCRISDDAGPKYNAESWNTNANIFFIDQPVGVGYSYADFGETVVWHSRKNRHMILMPLTEYFRRSRTGCCQVPRDLFRALYPIQRAEISPLRRIIRSELDQVLSGQSNKLIRVDTFLSSLGPFLTRTSSWSKPG